MADDDKLSERVDDDIAGVQGEDPESPAESVAEPGDVGADPFDSGTEVQAPDAAEIEWAGALVKKAPRSPHDA